MTQRSKTYREGAAQVDRERLYAPLEAVRLAKTTSKIMTTLITRRSPTMNPKSMMICSMIWKSRRKILLPGSEDVRTHKLRCFVLRRK